MMGTRVTTRYSSETAYAAAAIRQSGMTDCIKTQNEFNKALQTINQHWLGRIQSMAELGSAIASKLIEARSPCVSVNWQFQPTSLPTEWYILAMQQRPPRELESRLIATTDAADA